MRYIPDSKEGESGELHVDGLHERMNYSGGKYMVMCFYIKATVL